MLPILTSLRFGACDTKTARKHCTGIIRRIVQLSGQSNHRLQIQQIAMQLIQARDDSRTNRRTGAQSTRLRHIPPDLIVKAYCLDACKRSK